MLNEHGFEFKVQELCDSTRSAQDAAMAIGCSIPQIAKSIILKHLNKGSYPGMPVVLITWMLKKVASPQHHLVENVNAHYVREHTGFSIDGVSPIGLKSTMTIFIDTDLLQFDEIRAAAGMPNAVFKLKPKTLS